jgi:hypothetical protein
MSLIKLFLGGNNLIFPVQGEFDRDIPAGDGKMANFFYSVYANALHVTVLYMDKENDSSDCR